ncbi:MAG: CoA transferase [Pseudomonadota bacterium]|nr:CoA transferase [Pseudomonadota bacterium]
MSYFLDDLTVIDAATFLAGPGAATILADYGANVIKIEPPEGDGYRTLVGRYPVPYHWHLTSRNKRSLALDLSKDEGQKVIHQLLAKADVMTTNFMPEQLKRYRLNYEEVQAINPQLIFAHITGYGDSGPDANRRAFDVTGWWARSGMMEFIRDPEQVPLLPAPGMGDHSTATALFAAIMSGLYRRERTGEGSHVSTSLAATGVWANGMAIQGVIAGQDAGERRQRGSWPAPLGDCYRCADGRFIVLAIVNGDREYPLLCEALGHKDWLSDERFATIYDAMKHRDIFYAQVCDAFASRPYKEIAEQLETLGVTYAEAQSMGDVIVDEQLRANGIIVETGEPDSDYPLTVGSPIQIKGEPKRPPSRAPDVGADSVDVLRGMDFDEHYIAQLVRDGVVITQ